MTDITEFPVPTRVVDFQKILNAETLSEEVDALYAGEMTPEGHLPLVQIMDDQGDTEDVLRLTPEGVDVVLKPSALTAPLTELGLFQEPAQMLADGTTPLIQSQVAGQAEPFGTILGVKADGLVMRVSGNTEDRWGASVVGDATVYTAQAGMGTVDRFTDQGAVKMPSTTIDGTKRKAILISVYGQSNADVTNMDDPLVRDLPGMPNHVFTLNDHRPTDVGTTRGLHVGWQGVRREIEPTGLVPVREGELGGNRPVQSYSVAAAVVHNILTEKPYRVFSVRSSAWGGQGIIGNNPDEGLWKDSNGDYSTAWLNWADDLQSAYDLLIAAGYEVEAVHVHFTHQEKEWQATRASYLTEFLGMFDDSESMMAGIFADIPVTWFVDQASGSAYRNGKYFGNKWPARMAIIDAANARSKINMVMPRYHMTFGANNKEHLSEVPTLFPRTNYALNSGDFSGANWTLSAGVSRAVVGSEQQVSWSSSAGGILDAAVGKTPQVGETYTLSARVKVVDPGGANLGSDFSLRISDGGGTDDTGDVAVSLADDGEYRVVSITHTFTSPTGTGMEVEFRNGSASSPVLAIEYLQLEDGPGPSDHIETTTDPVTAWPVLEDIHHSNRARVMQGETYAHAKLALERGEEWRCPIMKSATVTGNSIVVEFDSLLALVIDESFTPVRAVDKGFRVNDGLIAITEVRQTGPRQITVDCASDPTGTKISYAYREQDAQDADEFVAAGGSTGWPIGTGAIRDAWEHPSLYMPGVRILRPALGYEITL